MIVSVSACGFSCTAARTAIRGRVTRRSAPRNRCSNSVTATGGVSRLFWNESRLAAAATSLRPLRLLGRGGGLPRLLRLLLRRRRRLPGAVDGAPADDADQG